MATNTHRHDFSINLNNIKVASSSIDTAFLDTPQFQSDILSHRLGMDLVLKVEIVNPIRCFKGRATDFFLSSLPSRVTTLVCASAGNFGQGLAYSTRRRGLKVALCW